MQATVGGFSPQHTAVCCRAACGKWSMWLFRHCAAQECKTVCRCLCVREFVFMCPNPPVACVYRTYCRASSRARGCYGVVRAIRNSSPMGFADSSFISLTKINVTVCQNIQTLQTSVNHSSSGHLPATRRTHRHAETWKSENTINPSITLSRKRVPHNSPLSSFSSEASFLHVSTPAAPIPFCFSLGPRTRRELTLSVSKRDAAAELSSR